MGMLQALLDWLRSLFFKKEMELSLIGLQNAGKTSLVNVIATGGFDEDMIPTVGFNMRKVTKGAVTIKLWDLGGQVSLPDAGMHANNARSCFDESGVLIPFPCLVCFSCLLASTV
mmetsp:Transcript_14124/g.35688  ORF Transcript_14124/g.35688 Transcript_14124/m.35688 type:complete len:115 (-) Transcript_14124:371-715(-)